VTRIFSGAAFSVKTHFDAIVEFESFDDFWQLISAIEAQPFSGCGLNEGEDHQFVRLLQECAFGANRPAPDGGA